jgi:hypothetical protein
MMVVIDLAGVTCSATALLLYNLMIERLLYVVCEVVYPATIL